jgi:hypothetical protein
MNRLRVFPLLVLLGSTSFCQPANDSNTTVFSTQPGRHTSCPIVLKAKWSRSEAKLLRIDSSDSVQQSLEVTLNNPDSLAVRQSRLTVYGLPPGVRLQPAVAYSLGGNPLEVAKSFTFDRTIEKGHSISVEVSAANMGLVTGINLDSLVYADGSSWRPSLRHPCQAVSQGAEHVPVVRP